MNQIIKTDTKVSMPLVVIVSVFCAIFWFGVSWSTLDSKIAQASTVNEQQQKEIDALKTQQSENAIQLAKIQTTLANVETTTLELRQLIMRKLWN